MFNLFKNLFKNDEKEIKKEMRVIAYGELSIKWTKGPESIFSIIFYENDNHEREYKITGRDIQMFDKVREYAECETWQHTGLLPTWAKDPVAEKLSR